MFGRRTILILIAAFGVSCSSNDGGNETPASFDPPELALVRVEPRDGESSVPRNRVVRLFFNTTVLPSSVHDQSISIRTGGTFQTAKQQPAVGVSGTEMLDSVWFSLIRAARQNAHDIDLF